MAKVSAGRRKIGKYIAGALFLFIGYNLAFENPKIIDAMKYLSRKRIEVKTDRLMLNENDIVAYVTKKSEPEGFKDMDDIIENSPHEDSWLRIPELNEWYEIGVERNEEADEAGAYRITHQTDLEYILRKIEEKRNQGHKIARADIIHNHPKGDIVNTFLKSLVKKPKNSIYKKIRAIEKKRAATTRYLRKAFIGYSDARPSITDIIFSILLTMDVKNEFPDIDLRFKIRSKDGTTEYFLTQEGYEHYRSLKKYDDILKTGAVATYRKDRMQLRSRYLNINFYPKDRNMEEKVLVF